MDTASKEDENVSITYTSREVQPPLFLAGSFSNPPWTPLEMKHQQTSSGEHVFTKTIRATPGTTIQYKFRVGPGDWWVLDESLPTATDDMGNRNNVLKIKEKKSHVVERPPTPPPDSPLAPRSSALKQSETLSLPGTSTPDFVQTTIEVADTAAQIDPKTPEPDISDEESGRIGYRRLSATPIAEVADTAAGAADAAEGLDFDEIDEIDNIEVDIGPDFSHELAGEEDNGQDEAPVFAYEFAGVGFDRAQSFSGSEHSPGTYPAPAQADGGSSKAELDLKDPTLERFPSNREGILQRVQTIETGLDEDVPAFDGFPPSPVVSAGRKSMTDLNGEAFSTSPTIPAVVFANWPQNGGTGYPPDARKRSVSKESAASELSPSLQCIVEENALDEEDEDEDALLSMPSRSKKVAVSGLDASPKTETVALPSLPAQHTSALDKPPSIAVHKPDTVTNGEQDAVNAPGGTAGLPAAIGADGTPTAPGAFPSSDPGGSGPAVSLALLQNDSSVQRTAQAATPVSLPHGAGVDAANSPNWLHAFVRLVFVDWIGRFFGNVFRRRSA